MMAFPGKLMKIKRQQPRTRLTLRGIRDPCKHEDQLFSALRQVGGSLADPENWPVKSYDITVIDTDSRASLRELSDRLDIRTVVAQGFAPDRPILRQAGGR